MKSWHVWLLGEGEGVGVIAGVPLGVADGVGDAVGVAEGVGVGQVQTFVGVGEGVTGITISL